MITMMMVTMLVIIALSYEDAGDMKMRTINDQVNDNTYTSQWSGGFIIRF